MKDAATLLALAERVEALAGPDAETVAQIRCAVFAPSGAYVQQSSINGAWCIYDGQSRDGRPRTWEATKLSHTQRLGDFTASLDAAMTLVPEGWRWWKAGDGRTGGSRMVVVDTATDGRFNVLGECPCPETVDRNALALTAAALRAIAAQAADEDNSPPTTPAP